MFFHTIGKFITNNGIIEQYLHIIKYNSLQEQKNRSSIREISFSSHLHAQNPFSHIVYKITAASVLSAQFIDASTKFHLSLFLEKFFSLYSLKITRLLYL